MLNQDLFTASPLSDALKYLSWSFRLKGEVLVMTMKRQMTPGWSNLVRSLCLVNLGKDVDDSLIFVKFDFLMTC